MNIAVCLVLCNDQECISSSVEKIFFQRQCNETGCLSLCKKQHESPLQCTLILSDSEGKDSHKTDFMPKVVVWKDEIVCFLELSPEYCRNQVPDNEE